MLWVGLAGPLTNFLLFGASVALGRLIIFLAPSLLTGVNESSLLARFTLELLRAVLFFIGIYAIINTILGFFNLIPIPPLDGSRILNYFLPARAQQVFAQLEQFGFLIILALLWFGGLRGLFSLLQHLWQFALGQTWFSLVMVLS